VKGAHQFGFGGSYLRMDINYASGINATGLPTFSGAITGLSMADFLLGDAVSWTQGNISYFYKPANLRRLYAQNVEGDFPAHCELWGPLGAMDAHLEQREPLRSIRPGSLQSGRRERRTCEARGLVFPGDPQWTSGNAVAQSYTTQVRAPGRLGMGSNRHWQDDRPGGLWSFTDRSGLYSLSSFGQDAPVGYAITLNSGTGATGA